MDKVWFIIREGEHLGPYSAQDLFVFFQESKVKLDSSIWKSGMDKPIPYRQIGDFDDLAVETLYSEVDVEYPQEYDEDDLDNILETELIETNLVVQVKPEAAPQDNLPPPLPQAAQIKGYEPSIKEKKIDQIDLDNIDDVLQLEKQHEINSKVEEFIQVELSGDEEVLDEVESIQEMALNKTSEAPEDLSHEEELDLNELESEVKKRSLINWYKFLPILIVIFCLGKLGLEYYQLYIKTFTKPAMMSSRDFDKIKRVLSFEDVQKSFSIFPAKDFSLLWVGINFKYNGRVLIELESIENKILSHEQIKFSSTGYLHNKFIEFDEFNFEKGIRITAGYYKVRFKLLRKDTHKTWIERVMKFDQTFDIETEVFLGTTSEELFDKELKQFLIKTDNADKELWQELHQKLETLKEISKNIYEDFVSILEQIATKKIMIEKLKDFESNYQSKYGHFLTSFVLENQGSYERIRDSKAKSKDVLIGYYEQVATLSKILGETSMEILSRFSVINQGNSLIIVQKTREELLIKLTSVEVKCQSLALQAKENF